VRALALLPVIACGRIDFDPRAPDAPIDAAAPALVGTVLASQANGTTTAMFPITPIAQNDVLLLHAACDGAGTATSVTASAPGWTFVQVGTLMGASFKWGALFGATVPDAAPTTVTITWNINCGSLDAIADELANVDPTPPYDSYLVATGSGNCKAAVQTKSDNDLIWAACSSGGTVVGVGAGYTKAGDDHMDDWSEYMLTADPAGTLEIPTFTVQPSGTFVMTTVALKPR
jgi:hypothetical protein